MLLSCCDQTMRRKMKSDQRQDLVCDRAEGSPQQLWPLNDRHSYNTINNHSCRMIYCVSLIYPPPPSMVSWMFVCVCYAVPVLRMICCSERCRARKGQTVNRQFSAVAHNLTLNLEGEEVGRLNQL